MEPLIRNLLRSGRGKRWDQKVFVSITITQLPAGRQAAGFDYKTNGWCKINPGSLVLQDPSDFLSETSLFEPFQAQYNTFHACTRACLSNNPFDTKLLFLIICRSLVLAGPP